MERKSCFIGDVICILIITAAVNERVATAQVEEFDFYRTQVHWPPSYCRGRGHHCASGILDYFTVFALIPMYLPNRPVPPYASRKNCTDKTPKTRNQIRFGEFSAELQQDMVEYMPNLDDYKSNQSNIRFWLRQWDKYAMCFTDPEKPQFYYHAALDVPKTMDLVKILKGEGENEIIPTNEHPYEASAIAEVISAFVTKRVQIHCNEDKDGKVQFLGVGVCFDKTARVMKCPEEFYSCEDEIWFPAAPSTA